MRIEHGDPNTMITLSTSALAIGAASWFGSAVATSQLNIWSWHLRMWLFPCPAKGTVPCNPNTAHGVSVISTATFVFGTVCLFVWHVRMYLFPCSATGWAHTDFQWSPLLSSCLEPCAYSSGTWECTCSLVPL
jgi:hypothetical protein